MPPSGEEYKEIGRLIRENHNLLKQNNEILHKLHRHNVIGFVLKVVWFAVLIGLPFVLYVYFVEPNVSEMQSSYKTFRASLEGIPGLSGLEKLLPHFGGGTK